MCRMKWSPKLGIVAYTWKQIFFFQVNREDREELISYSSLRVTFVLTQIHTINSCHFIPHRPRPANPQRQNLEPDTLEGSSWEPRFPMSTAQPRKQHVTTKNDSHFRKHSSANVYTNPWDRLRLRLWVGVAKFPIQPWPWPHMSVNFIQRLWGQISWNPIPIRITGNVWGRSVD